MLNSMRAYDEHGSDDNDNNNSISYLSPDGRTILKKHLRKIERILDS
jgi:hypothetical protein